MGVVELGQRAGWRRAVAAVVVIGLMLIAAGCEGDDVQSGLVHVGDAALLVGEWREIGDEGWRWEINELGRFTRRTHREGEACRTVTGNWSVDDGERHGRLSILTSVVDAGLDSHLVECDPGHWSYRPPGGGFSFGFMRDRLIIRDDDGRHAAELERVGLNGNRSPAILPGQAVGGWQREPPPFDSSFTFRAAGGAGGMNDCNRWGGEWWADVDDGSGGPRELHVVIGTSTAALCAGGEGLAGSRLVLDGDRIVRVDVEGRELHELARATSRS